MNLSIKIGNRITIKGNKYAVVGIDTYHLFNQLQKEKIWDSYTLVGNNERIGLTQIDQNFQLWRDSSANIQTVPGALILDNSGIANISFQGDSGPSTSIAELTWFNVNHKAYQYLVIERFLHLKCSKLENVDTHYYLGEQLNDVDINL
jgi:hypothetical protein